MYATSVISILILIAVLLPGSSIPDTGIGGVDKIVHFGMFAFWALATRHDLRQRRFPVALIIISGATFSIITELLQILIEDRTFDVYDMVADVIGVLAGIWVGRILLPKK